MEDRRGRTLALAAAMATGCVFSWLLMGGAELLDQVAAERGVGAAVTLALGGTAALAGVLYVAVGLFRWAWGKLPDGFP